MHLRQEKCPRDALVAPSQDVMGVHKDAVSTPLGQRDWVGSRTPQRPLTTHSPIRSPARRHRVLDRFVNPGGKLEILQSDAVAYRGQIVAAVVATTLETAREAADQLAGHL